MSLQSRAAAGKTILTLPAAAIYLGLFILPLSGLFIESLRPFEPGLIGGRTDAPLTAANYLELTSGSFAETFATTLRIGILASLAGVALALPLAYICARGESSRTARLLTALFILLMFLGVLIRAYALQLTLGSVGPFRPVFAAVGISPTSRTYIEFAVGAGLLHYILPLSALTLIGSFRALDPRLHESAQSLGASSWMAHATVTLPLCVPGILTAFLFSLTFSISAFVIPMILGAGRVNFVSTLVYTRFSEIANYPSGAAISIAILLLSLTLVLALSSFTRWWTGSR